MPAWRNSRPNSSCRPERIAPTSDRTGATPTPTGPAARLEGRILEANPAACRRLGYSHAELVQLRTQDIDELTALFESLRDVPPENLSNRLAAFLRGTVESLRIEHLNARHAQGMELLIELNQTVNQWIQEHILRIDLQLKPLAPQAA